MSDPAIVLLNPRAGGGRAAGLRRPIEQWLAHHAPRVPLLAPASADASLATLMVLAPRTRIVVVGGDGTVHALLPAFLRCGHRLGLVPAGQGNHLARALGLGEVDWAKALAFALKGRVAPIDVGQVQTEDHTAHFVASLALGLPAQVATWSAAAPGLLRGSSRRHWGRLAAWLRCAPTEARLWVNGQLEYEGRMLGASLLNTPSAGDATPAAPNARVDDGRLDAVVLDALGRLRLAWLLQGPRAAQAASAHPALHHFCGRKLLVDAHTPLALAVDGEPQPAASRITVQVLPRAVYAAGVHALPPRQPDTP